MTAKKAKEQVAAATSAVAALAAEEAAAAEEARVVCAYFTPNDHTACVYQVHALYQPPSLVCLEPLTTSD